MTSITIQSIPLDAVIKDIAQEFSVKHRENCKENSLNIPAGLGEGTIKAINFERGLGLIQYDCTFQEKVEVCFTLNEVHPLKFLYILEGELEHRFQNEKESHLINQYQNAIVASKGHNGHILKKLQYGFHNLYGLSVNNYVKKIRLQIAMELLKNSDLSISEIVYKIGLSSRSYFSKIFKEKYGITPSYYKKKTDPRNSN